MKAIFRWFANLYSGPLQAPLVFAFTAVAAITVGVGTWVISSTINNYLATTMDERVARDIRLANSYYELRLNEVAGVADRLAGNSTILSTLESDGTDESPEPESIQQEILREANGAMPNGNLFVGILDTDGNLLYGYFTSSEDDNVPVMAGGDWSGLPVVQTALQEGHTVASTEIIPIEYLETINLADQAKIELVDTPQAAEQLFDPREGTAGLALFGITPILDPEQHVKGMVIAFHIFNNDFTLVDQIKEVAGIDTVTIFMGDLRVSTNVMTAEGIRAVGTRLSKEVGDIVLLQGREYVGTAFVVDQDYITRYEPLYDQSHQIVGILYVGVRQASYLRLINAFDQRTTMVAFLTILMTFLLATPVSRFITQPLKELRGLVKASRRVAGGDLDARAPVAAGGEVGLVAESFNIMLDTLQATQDQLLHSEKLASLGQLAAGVAHELNNPLATILLYAETMQRECKEDVPTQADLKMIVNETRRCKRIVSDLLNFARQNQVIAQLTDLHGIIRELIELISRQDSKVTFKTELDPHLPVIEADPSQLRQVFLNLITNAIEAMPEGGTLTLRTRDEHNQTVTVEVQDTGIGIPDENLGRLFIPFFTTKPIGKGTGLGLAIAYGIVKMHRGQITARSKVGEGATFTINLPVKVPPIAERTLPGAKTNGDQTLIG